MLIYRKNIIRFDILNTLLGIIIFIAEKRDKTKLTKEIIDNVRQ